LAKFLIREELTVWFRDSRSAAEPPKIPKSERGEPHTTRYLPDDKLFLWQFPALVSPMGDFPTWNCHRSMTAAFPP
jgi:hypothetical protein